MTASTNHVDVEYSRTGELLKGKERAKARSKYDEDGKSTMSHPSKEGDNTNYQSIRTTTHQSGDHGSTGRADHGVSHVVIHRVSCAKFLSTPTRQATYSSICLWDEVQLSNSTNLQLPDLTVQAKQAASPTPPQPSLPSLAPHPNISAYKSKPRPSVQLRQPLQPSKRRPRPKKPSATPSIKKGMRSSWIKIASSGLWRRRRNARRWMRRKRGRVPRSPGRM